MKTIVVLCLVSASVLVPASPALAGDTVCVGVLGPIVVDNLVVPRDQICELEGTTVLGTATAFEGSALGLFPAEVVGGVKLLPRSRFIADNSDVGGNIDCDHCAFADAAGSRIGGNFQVTGETQGSFLEGNVIDGDLKFVESSPGTFSFDILENTIHGDLIFEKNTAGSFPATIDGNDVGGGMQLAENRTGMSVSNNAVGDNLLVLKTRGASEITGNRMRQNLKCAENMPQPVGAGNVAQKKEEQCALL